MARELSIIVRSATDFEPEIFYVYSLMMILVPEKRYMKTAFTMA